VGGSQKHQAVVKPRSAQFRAERGADGATAPGIHPGGHPRGQFSLKNVGK